jgi:hypothetical protein
MAYYSKPLPNDAGTLNSLFNVAIVVGLLAFAIASTYFFG